MVRKCEYFHMDGSHCELDAAVEWRGAWLCRSHYHKSKLEYDTDPDTMHNARKAQVRRNRRARGFALPTGRPGHQQAASQPAPPPTERMSIAFDTSLELMNDYEPGAVAVVNRYVPFLLTEEGYWQGGDDSRFSLDQLIKKFNRVDVYPTAAIYHHNQGGAE